jgi:hypothetical protein
LGRHGHGDEAEGDGYKAELHFCCFERFAVEVSVTMGSVGDMKISVRREGHLIFKCSVLTLCNKAVTPNGDSKRHISEAFIRLLSRMLQIKAGIR